MRSRHSASGLSMKTISSIMTQERHQIIVWWLKPFSLHRQWLCCWFHSHLFSHYLVLRAITLSTLDRIGRCCDAEINPYFTLARCPAWHTAAVKGTERRHVPTCCVLCAIQGLLSRCCSSPLLGACLPFQASAKGCKHQLRTKSY